MDEENHIHMSELGWTPTSAAHPEFYVSVSRVTLVLTENLVCLDKLERRYDINIIIFRCQIPVLCIK